MMALFLLVPIIVLCVVAVLSDRGTRDALRIMYVVDYRQANGYLVRLPAFLAHRLVSVLKEREVHGTRCWDVMTPALYRLESH